MGLLYSCCFCASVFETEKRKPDGLDLHALTREQIEELALRQACPQCGKVAAPLALTEKQGWQKTIVTSFSRCRNAFDCAGLGAYTRECEEGKVTQSCLALVHTRLDVLYQDVLEILERLPRK